MSLGRRPSPGQPTPWTSERVSRLTYGKNSIACTPPPLNQRERPPSRSLELRHLQRTLRARRTSSRLQLLARRLRAATKIQKARQIPAASTFSPRFGEKMRMKPRPFTSAAKLETQNGIRKSRNTVQPPTRVPAAAPARVLSNRAKPTITLRPIDVSQSSGFGSK
jgi:hypothetical protein